MLIRRATDLPSSELTPEGVYVNRRAFIAAAGAVGLGAIAGGLTPRALHAAVLGAQDPQVVGKPFGLQSDD